MNYTVDYFIEKFSAIPETKWCINRRENDLGQRCAHGHCYSGSVGENGSVEKALSKLSKELGYKVGLAPINNGDDERYQQPTPKQRIMAALYDIKKMQEPIKERIVYVTVDEKVREIQNAELIEN